MLTNRYNSDDLHRRISASGYLNKSTYIYNLADSVSSNKQGYVKQFTTPTFVNANSVAEQVTKVATNKIRLNYARLMCIWITPNTVTGSFITQTKSIIAATKTTNTDAAKYTWTGGCPWLVTQYPFLALPALPKLDNTNPVSIPISKESNQWMKLLYEDELPAAINTRVPQAIHQCIIPLGLDVDVPDITPGASWQLEDATGEVPQFWWMHGCYAYDQVSQLITNTWHWSLEIFYNDIGEPFIEV